MPEAYRKQFIVGTAFLLILALLGAGISVYLSSDAFRKRLLAAINNTITGEISLGQLDLNLFSGALALTDLRLNSADGESVVVMDQVKVRFDWWPLVYKHVHINELSVAMDDVMLLFDARDRPVLLDVLSSPLRQPPDEPDEPDEQKGGAWKLSVDDLHLVMNRMGFHRPVADMRAQAEQVDISGRLDLGKQDGAIRIKVGQATWDLSGCSGLVRDVHLEVSNDPGLQRPLALTVQTPHSGLRLTAAPNWSDPLEALDAEITCDLDWGDIRPWLSPWISSDMPFSGVISGRVRVGGRLFDPSVSLDLTMNPSTLAGMAIQDFQAHITLKERLMTVEKVESRGTWGRLNLDGRMDLRSMFKQDFSHVDAGPEALSYDMTLKADGVRPQGLAALDLPVHGIWNGRFMVKGNGIGDPDATGQGTVQLDGAMDTGSGPVQGSFNTQLGWQGRQIEVSGLQAKIGPNLLEASGRIDPADAADWTGAKIDVNGELSLPQPSLLESITGIEFPTGRGHLRFACSGPLARPRVTGTVLARELAYRTWNFGQIFFNIELDHDGVLQVSDMMLENQGTVISGHGRSKLVQADGRLDPDPGLSAQLAIENLQLSDFGLLEALKGRLNGNLDISGRLTDPTATLVLSQSPLGWRNMNALAKGSAGWRNGCLDVKALQLSKGTSMLDLSGTLNWRNAKTGQWTAVPFLDLQAASSGLELNDFLPDYHHGHVVLRAMVKGPASDLRGDFNLEAGEVRFPAQQVNAITLKGRLADAAVHIDQMDVTVAPDQQLTGQGWYAFDHRYHVSLAAKSINLRHIDTLQHVYPVDGLLSVSLDGSGTFAQPNLNIALTVTDPQFNGRGLDDFTGKFFLAGNDIRFQGDLNFQVEAQGNLDTHAYSITADFHDTDLAPYLAILQSPSWSGRLSGRLQADGDWHALEKTIGRLEINQAHLLYDQLPFMTVRGLDLQIKDNGVTMPKTRLGLLQNGYLDIRAAGNLLNDIQVSVDGSLPLNTLAPLTDAMADVSGMVDLQARTWGPLSELQWQADFDLKDIGFGLPDFSQVVEELNGTVRVRPDRVTVENIAGNVDNGRFELGGGIRLDGRVPSDGHMDLSLHALPLQWPGIMEMVLSGDMTLEGDPEGATLSGDLVLVEGSYFKDVSFNLLSGITQTRRARPVPEYRPKPDWMKQIALDLKLRHRNAFSVENNLASLEVTPDFQLGGTLDKPIMSGRAEVTEGELMYARKTFTVERGVVDFINPDKIEPNLDIKGTVEFRKWVITLGVSGTPDNLDFTLSSDPEESDSDILSLLLVGRTNAEMTQGEGGGGRTTNQMLAQLLATAWGENIKREAGVDIFEVGTGSEENTDDPTSMQLTVGKKLSRRLTIKYDVETQEGETIQRAISEYRFLEHILASGFQDSRGKYGGELLFRMDYR